MKKLTTKEFIEKAKKIHQNSYDYSLVTYRTAHNKIDIICSKHGKFSQLPYNHLNGNGCPSCSNKKIYVKEFIERSKIIHHDKYTYFEPYFKGYNNKTTIFCPIKNHGNFIQTPKNHLAGEGCPKCGGTTLLTTKEFIEKSKKIHQNKYNYSLTDYTGSKNSMIIICKYHGAYKQRASTHLEGAGCSKCAADSQKYDNFTFILKANHIHNYKYDYSNCNYTGIFNKINILCPQHGIFNQEPNAHLNGQGCPKCKESKGEKAIRIFLELNNIKYICQYKFKDCKNVFALPFDFALFKNNNLSCLIEFQGKQHYEASNFGSKHINKITVFEKIKYRDSIKYDYCTKNRIPLFLIPYMEQKNINKIMEYIIDICNIG
jgi:hypothetical protein